eukprot:2994299-Prymnesium_polylepis.2
MAMLRLEKSDETAALIASERATAGNPRWGCCIWLQSRLMGRLGRHVALPLRAQLGVQRGSGAGRQVQKGG